MLSSRTSSRQFPKIQVALVAMVLAMALLPVASDLSATLAESVGADRAAAEAQVLEQLETADLAFVENRGQLDKRVRFYVQGSDASLYFTDRGVRMSLSPEGTHKPAEGAGDTRWVIDHAFLNAAPVQPIATTRAETTVSYFKGDKKDWHAGLPTYESVTYPNVWPGIDLVYRGTASGLKYDLIVQPGANPNAIALAYQHAGAQITTSTGDLEITTPVGTITDTAPIAYQGSGSTRTQVPVSFSPTGKHYGFQVGAYNRSLPLVIDPTVLVYSGFIGGDGNDSGRGIAVDSSGAAYVTGTTDSTDGSFPETGGPDLVFNGATDAFVAKVAPGGNSLIYAGYIGGNSFEDGNGIAVDSSGAAYVTGTTSSTEATFPVTVGPDVIINGGFSDAFVAKVAPSGTSLTYAGYIGGNDQDLGYGIAVDSSGAAYVTGTTSSTEATFPVVGGPDLVSNGFQDAFVARVAPGGGSLTYAGYIGGNSVDEGSGIAVDSSGAAYVAGRTGSTEASFPVAGGPDVNQNGSIDSFVAKVVPGGGSLTYAGYIGGTGIDFGNGIAVDSAGAAYVTGETNSTAASFPVDDGPDLDHNGSFDAYVAKVAPNGNSLAYAGYIGGSGFEQGHGIAVDSVGAAYVTGLTNSTEASFPVIDGPELTFDGIEDVFVTKVAPDGMTLPYSGYIGGAAPDNGFGIAVDGSGAAYVTGLTGFSDQQEFRFQPGPASFPTLVGPDLSHNGQSDAFVAKVGGQGGQPGGPMEVHPLTVHKAGNGTGLVTSDVTGIDCGTDCHQLYDDGDEVLLTHTAEPGSIFTGWAGDCNGTEICLLDMTEPREVTATFELAGELTVTKSGSGAGTVMSLPAGITCGPDCSNEFVLGTVVTLTSTPAQGSELRGWTGCVPVNDNQCTVTVGNSTTVDARFGLIRRNRTISLQLDRHLIATGKVKSPDEIAACVAHVPVVIERRVDTEWKEESNLSTDDDGTFRGRVDDRPGIYRAVAIGVTTNLDGRCVGVHSDRAEHEHNSPQQR